MPPDATPSDATGNAVRWRRFDARVDDVAAITALLHAAYAELAALGLNYTASYQTDEVTLRRLEAGTGLLGLMGERVVATIAIYLGTNSPDAPPLYHRDDTAFFGQFAVDPAMRRQGLGTHLIALAESFARDRGKAQMALDTAEPARHLIAYYERLGYRTAGYTSWAGKTYRSVVMAKPLGEEG